MTRLDEAVAPPREHTRRDLIGEAMRLFGERGYHATSLRDIASAVGCSKAAVLYHFPSKAAVFAAAIAPALRELSDLVARLAALPAEQAREQGITGLVDVVLAHRELVAMFTEALSTRQCQVDLPEATALGGQLLELLADPADADARAMAMFALLGINAYCREVEEPDDILRRHLETALRALLSEPGSRALPTSSR